jgi:transcriptional regulator with XRE-family HTH domain
MSTRSEDVRLRLRDEMTRRKLSQRDVAGLLGWSQSKVAHILTGHVVLSVDDLADFCFALGLRLTEAVRDHGLEFCAEMTPTELRIVERVRQLPKPWLDAVMTLLDLKQKTNAPERHAGIIRKK